MQHKANFLNNSLFSLLLLGLLGITSCKTVMRLNVKEGDGNALAPQPRGVSIDFEEEKGPALGDTLDEKMKKMLDDRIKGQNPSEKLLDYAKCGHFLRLRNKDYPEAARVVKYLVERGADVNAQYEKNKWTPLHFAVCNENKDLVKALLSSGADLTIKDDYGRTPLHIAAKHGALSVVKDLIKAGADINVKDKDSQTPLHIAAQHGPLSVVEDLIKAGANFTIKDKNDKTAYAIAEENKDQGTMDLLYRERARREKLHSEIMKASPCLKEIIRLIDSGVCVNAKGDYGWTPLHAAVENDHADVVRALISRGADVNIKDDYGWTPLHATAGNNDESIVRALISSGADLTIQDDNGRTPLHRAVLRDDKSDFNEVVEALVSVDSGAHINLKDKAGRTPLRIAVGNGNHTIVQDLISGGADLTIKDDKDKTVYEIAISEYTKAMEGSNRVKKIDCERIVELLEERGANTAERKGR